MNQLDLMVLLTLDHPWEIRRQYHMKADGPGFFTRLARRLRPTPPSAEPAGLVARAAGRDHPDTQRDDTERRAA
ncbi:MAG TPA: hypothetical protein VFD32_20445 [Dehalococcoidia bacterium]|nr:hypothetical protein [Dehalococcoidia bacterium]